MANIIEKINQIRSHISEGNNIDRDLVTEVISDPIIRAFMIQYLSSANNFKSSWFRALYDLGLFDFNNIPGPVALYDADGKESRGFNAWDAVFLIWEAGKQDVNKNELLPLLLELINNYIEYVDIHKEDPERNPTTDYYFCQLIFLLPEGVIADKHLDFLVNFGLKRDRSILTNDLTGKFFDKTLGWSEKGMPYRLLDIFFTPSSAPSDYKMHSVVDPFYLEQFIKRVPGKLYDALGDEIIEWLTRKIKALNKDYTFQFLKFNIPSLEPDSQNNHNEGLSMSIVNLLVNVLQIADPQFTNHIVTSFVKDDTLILQRIAFYFVDQRYDQLKELFWNYNNPLALNEIKLEVYRLLNRHCEDFDLKEIEIVVNWIDQLIVSPEVEDKVDIVKYAAYEKLEWITALEPIRFRTESVASRYKQLLQITENNAPKHPGYDSYFSIRPGGDFSKKERILKMDPVKVLNLLADKDAWEGYNHWGLEQDVREYVLTNASLVMGHTKQFIHIPIKFLYNFADGFRTLAEQKATLNYEQLLAFFLKLVETRAELWDFGTDGRDKSGAVGMISWLIQAILQVEEVGGRPEILDLSAHLLLLLDEKYTQPFEWLNNDPGFDIINATRGKLYRAMITCSLNSNKNSGDKPGIWRNDIRERFTSHVLSANNEEFFWSIGFYTPEVSYLDFDWLTKYKDNIYQDREVFGGDIAFYGYLMYAARVYNNIFELLYNRYVNALLTDIKQDLIKRRLSEHIYVAYVIGLPQSNQLMEALLDSGNPALLKCLVDRMRTPDLELTDKLLITLWTKVLDIAEYLKDRAFRQSVAETVELLDQTKTVNEDIFSLFERAVGFFDFGAPTYRLMRAIETKANQGLTDEAGRLLYLLLEKANDKIYLDIEMINQILLKLYRAGEKDLADNIALSAVNRKDFEAVPIYNQFQN